MAIGERTPRAWFVDAWAVRDGRIFASYRPAESIAADSTIFLAVPDLEPVPVGRISTALRATRSGFQEGLRDESGDEIPFESVDQVRELCRRGFLGGGLGPGAPGVGPIPYPAPEAGPDGAMLAELEYALEDAEAWEPRALRTALGRLHGYAIAQLVAYSESLMNQSLGTWFSVERSAHTHEDSRRLTDARVRMWLWLAGNRIIDHALPDIDEFGARHVGTWPWGYEHFGDRWAFDSGGVPAQPRPNDASLAPLSLPYQRYPLTRLAELAIIASITEDFAPGKSRIEYIAATATWHMVRLAGRRYPIAVNTERLMKDALREVSRNAPGVQLPGAANEALDRWIRDVLEPGPRPSGVTP